MNKNVISGAILASAVAMAFVATKVQAQASGSSSSTTAQAAKIKCMGGNDCSGKSACKTASSPGPGQNSCKGEGFVYTSSDKDCTDKGGKPQSM
ncbi:MAG TPA: hypothetical protein VMD75_08345 [Candidatus Binataceae bacterium]|nr:hypothetical protein [Candidatus Binataceae bacterium]